MNPSELLTIFSLIVAAWAIIPPAARFGFRLSMSMLDWLVVILVLGAIHVLVLEKILRAAGAYPDLGPWRWGFDKASAVYLMFAALACYVGWRLRRLHLNVRNLPVFAKLVTELLHARKLEALGDLLHQHIETLFDLQSGKSAWPRIDSWLRPKDLDETHHPDGHCRELRLAIADRLQPTRSQQRQASELLRQVLSSREFVRYFAATRPYLCVDIMRRADMLVDDFQSNFFQTQLSNEAGVLFNEVKDNDGRGFSNGKWSLSGESPLLSFYLRDVNVAANLQVYRAVGDAVLDLLADDDASKRLNRPLGKYREVGQFRCPIHCGIEFFRLMVQAGLHQRLADHLWMHYLPHFAEKILERMDAMPTKEGLEESPTPFCYLLRKLVDVPLEWIEAAAHHTSQEDVIDRQQREGRHVYISFEATETLGRVMNSLMSSDKLSKRFRGSLLETVLRAVQRLNSVQGTRLEPLIAMTIDELISPLDYGVDHHLAQLTSLWADVDGNLRIENEGFGRALTQCVQARRN